MKRERVDQKHIFDTGKWEFSFTIHTGGGEGARQLLTVADQGREAIRVQEKNGKMEVFLWTYEKDAPLLLCGKAEAGENRVALVWTDSVVRLWINDVLADEEWPIGRCLKSDEAELWISDGIADCAFAAGKEDRPLPTAGHFTEAQYWKPAGCNVGDCMPFYDGENFHVYYLKDRHGHKSKWGLGAHQFAHISSPDLLRWEEHPMAVEITHPWEGSICTGSIVKKEDLYYAFYAVRMSDKTSAKVSWATSRDGISFTKSEQYFSLQMPYETTSVRDPAVFMDAQKTWHMLLTTDYLNAAVPQRRGCLAHLVSKDLENWEQTEPFLVPGYTDQPECSDYFEWNGWYYLIFSNYGFAKYRYAKQPFGPFLKPREEVLDAGLYRVPKSAAFTQNRRILAGFLAQEPWGRSYGGNLVFRELVQHPDGTLGSRFVSEMLPKESRLERPVRAACTERECYRTVPLMTADRDFYLDICVRRQEQDADFGFLLSGGGIRPVEIRIEPSGGCAGIYDLHTNLFERNCRVLYHVCPAKEMRIRLLVKGDILDCCLDDDRTMVCRLEKEGDGEQIRIEGFVKDGAVEFY